MALFKIIILVAKCFFYRPRCVVSEAHSRRGFPPPSGSRRILLHRQGECYEGVSAEIHGAFAVCFFKGVKFDLSGDSERKGRSFFGFGAP